nr:MAG TPA: Flavin adenine dinucleotide (FAD)-dependent sulfhydryl oxidase [Bacteriophage sp.]
MQSVFDYDTIQKQRVNMVWEGCRGSCGNTPRAVT